MPVKTSIQLRRGTASDWTSTNPVLAAGEPGVESDTGAIKIGDGTTAWTSLGYALSSRYASLPTWTAWTPTITSASGTITAVTVGTCAYWKSGNLFKAYGVVQIDTVGTGAGGLRISLPSGISWAGMDAPTWIGGYYDGWYGNFGGAVWISGNIELLKHDGATPIVVNSRLRFNVSGRVAT